MNGMLVFVQPAKGADDFHRCAETGKRRNSKNLGFFNRAHAFVGVFVQQGLQYTLGLFAIAGEVVAFFDLFSPFFAGKRRLVPGYVANQIERVEFLARLATNFFSQRLEKHPFVSQFVDDGLFFSASFQRRKKSSSELNSLASALRV